MDIHHLKVFISVYKNKSFSKAGEELLITQPTISEHIKYLEKYLKTKLFDRIGRQIYPTEKAKLLYLEAVKIVEDFESLKNKLEDRKEKNIEINIISSSVPGNYILPKFTALFKKHIVDSVISIKVTDSTEVIKKILSDEAIVGFIGTQTNNRNIEEHLFLKDEIVLVGDLQFNYPDEISLRDITKYSLISRELGSGTRKEVERFFEKNGFNPAHLNIGLIVESNEALKQSVLSGAGIAFISKYCIENEIRSKMLKKISLKEGNIERNFYWIKKRGRSLPRVYLNFLKLLTQVTAT